MLREWPGFPEETRPALTEAHEAIVGLFSDAGVGKIDSLELPGLALAGVRYDKWIRFMLPLMVLLGVACLVMLGIAALLE